MAFVGNFRQLAGLPAYGTSPVTFPAAWSKSGREGAVVEFTTAARASWIGNFEPGEGGANAVHRHPDGHSVLVVAEGNAWSVDPEKKAAELVLEDVTGCWVIPGEEDLLLSLQGISLARLGSQGLVWETRRISWDGLELVSINRGEVTGLAGDPTNSQPSPFRVDLLSGFATGGSYPPDRD